MGKVEDKKNHKKEKLLNTAFSLFADKGLNKTSVSDITSKAGVAKGTFYLYFHDKYDIKGKLVERKCDELFDHALERAGRSKARTFEDQLILILDDILNRLAGDSTTMKFINKNLSTGLLRENFIRRDDGEMGKYAAQLSEMMRNTPGVEWREPDIMLFSILELVGSTCYSVIMYQYPADLEHFKPYLYKYVRGIIKNHQINKKAGVVPPKDTAETMLKASGS